MKNFYPEEERIKMSTQASTKIIVNNLTQKNRQPQQQKYTETTQPTYKTCMNVCKNYKKKDQFHCRAFCVYKFDMEDALFPSEK